MKGSNSPSQSLPPDCGPGHWHDLWRTCIELSPVQVAVHWDHSFQLHHSPVSETRWWISIVNLICPLSLDFYISAFTFQIYLFSVLCVWCRELQGFTSLLRVKFSSFTEYIQCSCQSQSRLQNQDIDLTS